MFNQHGFTSELMKATGPGKGGIYRHFFEQRRALPHLNASLHP